MTATDLIDMERAWRAQHRTLDTGSYCENASGEAVSSSRIIQAIKELGGLLLEHERSGYKFPKAQGTEASR